MSAPNFMTMENFPLFVIDTPYCKVCPNCGCTCGTDDKECLDCGADISAVENVYDEWTDEDNIRNMEAAAKSINEKLDFFEVTVESGRYCGCQFFVDSAKDSPEDMDNEECQYYYGKCRSKAIRSYNAEIRKVNKWLVKMGEELGLTELNCMGIFSNGEAVYSKVERPTSTKQPKVKKVA